MAAETARRLGCDASVVAIVEDEHGSPLDVGRKRRSIPPALRRALQSRDRTCRFPGCTSTAFLDAHHVLHWAKGGGTSLANCCLLCTRHHRAVHEGGYRIEATGDPVEPWAFLRPDGSQLSPRPALPPATDYRAIARQHRRQGLDIDPQASVPEWCGEQLDLAMAIDGLVALDRP
ncbi:MAG TPA: DUF222 domain-containing protein [Acidimicrobiales bacterium]|nr:DUF222 domain-containing protein [Acidimicrobiales bacterium]